MTVRVLLPEINVWISGLRMPSPRGWAPPNLLMAWVKQKAEKGRIHSLPACLTELTESAALQLEFIPPTCLVLRPSNTGFPGSPVCRQQMVEFLSLHNHRSWFLNKYLNRSYFKCPIGPVSLENSNTPVLMVIHVSHTLVRLPFSPWKEVSSNILGWHSSLDLAYSLFLSMAWIKKWAVNIYWIV